MTAREWLAAYAASTLTESMVWEDPDWAVIPVLNRSDK